MKNNQTESNIEEYINNSWKTLSQLTDMPVSEIDDKTGEHIANYVLMYPQKNYTSLHDLEYYSILSSKKKLYMVLKRMEKFYKLFPLIYRNGFRESYSHSIPKTINNAYYLIENHLKQLFEWESLEKYSTSDAIHLQDSLIFGFKKFGINIDNDYINSSISDNNYLLIKEDNYYKTTIADMIEKFSPEQPMFMKNPTNILYKIFSLYEEIIKYPSAYTKSNSYPIIGLNLISLLKIYKMYNNSGIFNADINIKNMIIKEINTYTECIGDKSLFDFKNEFLDLMIDICFNKEMICYKKFLQGKKMSKVLLLDLNNKDLIDDEYNMVTTSSDYIRSVVNKLPNIKSKTLNDNDKTVEDLEYLISDILKGKDSSYYEKIKSLKLVLNMIDANIDLSKYEVDFLYLQPSKYYTYIDFINDCMRYNNDFPDLNHILSDIITVNYEVIESLRKEDFSFESYFHNEKDDDNQVGFSTSLSNFLSIIIKYYNTKKPLFDKKVIDEYKIDCNDIDLYISSFMNSVKYVIHQITLQFYDNDYTNNIMYLEMTFSYQNFFPQMIGNFIYIVSYYDFKMDISFLSDYAKYLITHKDNCKLIPFNGYSKNQSFGCVYKYLKSISLKRQ